MDSRICELVLFDGTPWGLRSAELINDPIKGFVSPRNGLARLLALPEMNQPGVYVLCGDREGTGMLKVYVGEAEAVRQRLRDHDSRKNFWQEVVVFVAGGKFDKSVTRYLESVLVKRLKEDAQVDIVNSATPDPAPLPDGTMVKVAPYLQNILNLLHLLGYPIARTGAEAPKLAGRELIISMGEVVARGHDGDREFTVLADSTARSELLSSANDQVRAIRATLLKEGILEAQVGTLRFTKDYEFKSPSVAASLVLGRSSNGLLEWKTGDGRTLKEVQKG